MGLGTLSTSFVSIRLAVNDETEDVVIINGESGDDDDNVYDNACASKMAVD